MTVVARTKRLIPDVRRWLGAKSGHIGEGHTATRRFELHEIEGGKRKVVRVIRKD